LGQVHWVAAAFDLQDSAAASLAATVALLSAAAVVVTNLGEIFGETAVDS